MKIFVRNFFPFGNFLIFSFPNNSKIMKNWEKKIIYSEKEKKTPQKKRLEKIKENKK